VAAVVGMAVGLVAQAKPSFADEWKIVADPDNGGGRGGPGIDLTSAQSARISGSTSRPRPTSIGPGRYRTSSRS